MVEDWRTKLDRLKKLSNDQKRDLDKEDVIKKRTMERQDEIDRLIDSFEREREALGPPPQ